MARPAVTSSSIALIEIRLEPLTRAAFAPFGWLLEGGSGPPSFTRPGLEHWRFPFEADAPFRLQVMRYHRQALQLSRLERHIAVTEARMPVAANRAVLVVADDKGDRDPEPETVRAFLLDGSAGIMFKQGTWHGLDCFPVDGPHADFLFLTDQATEAEIEAQPTPVSGQRTHIADYPSDEGPAFVIRDLDGLI
ncbi:MAG: ureidoglycolate lyase [Pseudomonadota bacterium]